MKPGWTRSQILFENGTLAERLAETVEQLDNVVELLSEVEPPKGYGRD